MLLQRLATGATGVKQARYRRRPTRGSEALVCACAQRECVYVCAVECETSIEFRRGFCTLVLFIALVWLQYYKKGIYFPWGFPKLNTDAHTHCY